MPAHHLHQRGNVWRAAGGGGEYLADLVEVAGPENAGAGDCKECRARAAAVLKAVDGPAWHADRLAHADLDRLTVDRPGCDPLEPVDRLLEGIVAVGRWHFRIRWDVTLEDTYAAVGVGALDEEADAELTDRNGLSRGLIHCGLLCSW